MTGRLAFPFPWVDAAPGAKQVLVRLGGQLYDDGLLGPPYDERTFNPGEPITSADAGPARLIALMRLSGYASAVGHPRAPEWTLAARKGFPTVPPTAIPPKLRAQWPQVM